VLDPAQFVEDLAQLVEDIVVVAVVAERFQFYPVGLLGMFQPAKPFQDLCYARVVWHERGTSIENTIRLLSELVGQLGTIRVRGCAGRAGRLRE